MLIRNAKSRSVAMSVRESGRFVVLLSCYSIARWTVALVLRAGSSPLRLALLFIASIFGALPALAGDAGVASETSTRSIRTVTAETGHDAASSGRINPRTISEACPADITVQLPAATPVASAASFRPRSRDRSCFVSAESILRRRSGESQFVDVRHAADFEQYRIPGSLNIPLHSVKTKAFLKAGFLVLVNDGHSTAELETGCSELKKAGFTSVSILDGGLATWRTRGGLIDGDAYAQRQLDRMSSAALFAERLYDDWLVLDFSTAAKGEVRKWLPPSVERIPAANALPALKAVAARVNLSKRPLRLLIVSNTGSDYPRIEKQAHQAGLKGALYLEAGLQGYSDFLSKQVAMWEQKTNPPKLPACRG